MKQDFSELRLDAVTRRFAGAGGAAFAALVGVVLPAGLSDLGMVSSFGFLATMGAAMFGAGAFPLPRWARLRRRQMEEVAARIAPVAISQPTNDRLT